ncbi:hypothetical protein MLD38_025843 [Melastoma candidum]|uniref:Uncharacterized protein n=1 Tax=Melastoma candidum TaxID=119954 RepID=A0ACB9NY14_9MYRT|nr:hypothetical protein MLD38_025843 [Melastoma candidum]
MPSNSNSPSYALFPVLIICHGPKNDQKQRSDRAHTLDTIRNLFMLPDRHHHRRCFGLALLNKGNRKTKKHNLLQHITKDQSGKGFPFFLSPLPRRRGDIKYDTGTSVQGLHIMSFFRKSRQLDERIHSRHAF